ncbi:hypothetical protein [Oceanobacillus rekensis]|uniref:hypothetical protein n=1 Tax=Oceanobacillus rekensis TaxID=937927 RepID=UPI001592FFC5|nr:hypothetical protein [Oceanobacillus rekensis]
MKITVKVLDENAGEEAFKNFVEDEVITGIIDLIITTKDEKLMATKRVSMLILLVS